MRTDRKNTDRDRQTDRQRERDRKRETETDMTQLLVAFFILHKRLQIRKRNATFGRLLFDWQIRASTLPSFGM